MSRSRFAFTLCVLGVAATSVALTTTRGQTASDALEGAWSAREYVLASGARHVVRGRIHFTDRDWQVLFFVMDGETPARGSAEGGRYTFDGETLTFEHLHHLSVGETLEGLPASDLRMTARTSDGPMEPTGVRIEGDRLVLEFPSGNEMSFDRSSGGS